MGIYGHGQKWLHRLLRSKRPASKNYFLCARCGTSAQRTPSVLRRVRVAQKLPQQFFWGQLGPGPPGPIGPWILGPATDSRRFCRCRSPSPSTSIFLLLARFARACDARARARGRAFCEQRDFCEAPVILGTDIFLRSAGRKCAYLRPSPIPSTTNSFFHVRPRAGPGGVFACDTHSWDTCVSPPPPPGGAYFRHGKQSNPRRRGFEPHTTGADVVQTVHAGTMKRSKGRG